MGDDATMDSITSERDENLLVVVAVEEYSLRPKRFNCSVVLTVHGQF